MRSNGAVVDVWPCDVVERYNDYPSRDMVTHFTRLPSSSFGELRSLISHKCVETYGGSVTGTVDVWDCQQSGYTKDNRNLWKFENGRIIWGKNDKYCLKPNFDAPVTGNDGVNGYSLGISLCDDAHYSSAMWVMETNSLIVYPAPDSITLSKSMFTVTVQPVGDDKNVHQLFTYFSEPGNSHENNAQTKLKKDFSWVTFAFADLPQGILVTVNSANKFTTCDIAPRQLNIACKIINNFTVQFVILQPLSKISVEFDRAAPNDSSRIYNVVTHALMIFGDDPESITDTHIISSESVIFFPPGYHNIDCMTLKEGDHVYIAGGAYLSGSLQTFPGTNNVKITGRGIITGGSNKCSTTSIIHMCGGRNMQVNGVSVIDAMQGAIGGHIGINTYWGGCNTDTTSEEGGLITNVKVAGWQYGADGIFVGRNGKVTDSFIRYVLYIYIYVCMYEYAYILLILFYSYKVLQISFLAFYIVYL